MSSIISDIFYNSNNNGLIDQYLQLRGNKDIIPSSDVQDQSLHLNNNRLLGSGQISQLSANDPFHNPHIHLAFNITINYPVQIPKQSPLSSSYTLSLQLGITKIQQSHIHYNTNKKKTHPSTLQFNLPLSIPASELYDNKVLSINLSEQNKITDGYMLIGCCYLPLENVRKMMVLEENYGGGGDHRRGQKKMFTLWMRDMRGGKKGQNCKYQVECQVRIGKNQVFIGSDFDTSYNQKSRQWNHQRPSGITQQPLLFTHSKPQNQIKQPNFKKSHQYIKPMTSPINKSDKIQLSNFSNSILPTSQHPTSSLLSVNQTHYQNQVLKFQLENKICRFVVRQFVLKKQKLGQKEGDKGEGNEEEVGGDKLRFKFGIVRRMYEIGEEIGVKSADIDNEGIKGSVVCRENGNIKGYFHLNIVLLFGGCIEGIFPVCEEQSNRCIGVVRIQSPEKQNSNWIQPSSIQSLIQQNSIPHQLTQNVYKTSSPPILQGYIFKILRLSLMPTTLVTLPKHELSLCHLVFRLSPSLSAFSNNQISSEIKEDQFVKIVRQCQIKEDRYFKRICEIIVREPIFVGLQGGVERSGSDFVEIQVYLQDSLVGYAKLLLQNLNSSSQINTVKYGSVIENLTVENCVCHIALNYCYYKITKNFLPSTHLQQTLKHLHNSQLLLPISQLQPIEQLSTFLNTLILTSIPNTTYMQSNRLTSLLTQMLQQKPSDNLCILFDEKNKKNKEERYSWRKQLQSESYCSKLMEEIYFVDHEWNGYVYCEDMRHIGQYYGIEEEDLRECCRMRAWDGEIANEGQILYLILLTGCQIQMKNIKKHFRQQRKDESKKVRETLTLKNKQEGGQIKGSFENQEHLSNKNNDPSSLTEAPQKPKIYIHIHSLQILCCHRLMPLNKIPSIRIYIPSIGYKTRPVYSCSNPIVKLNKKIGCGEQIRIMHYDVKDDIDQEICKVILDHKIEEYGLGDGATLRILAMQ